MAGIDRIAVEFVDYYAYIQSPAWYTRTLEVRKRNRGKCECCCMRSGSAVHHRTYERLGCELPEDLIHLCDLCHKMVHKKGSYYIWPSRVPVLEKLRLEMKEYDSSFKKEREDGESDTPW